MRTHWFRERLLAHPTKAERALLVALKGDGEVQFQHPVGVYFVDFAWPRLHLAVEIDGEIHRRDSAWHRDGRRTAHLEAAGWQVVRFQNEEVLNTPHAIVCEIRRLLAHLARQ